MYSLCSLHQIKHKAFITIMYCWYRVSEGTLTHTHTHTHSYKKETREDYLTMDAILRFMLTLLQSREIEKHHLENF